MDKTPYQELVGFLKRADNYTQDTRNWPDPTEPRAAKPPMPEGCTCTQGNKLDCPIHGLNGENPWDATLDHSWSLPENSPVGYPQDQPRNWTQVVSREWNPVVVGQSEGEIVPGGGHLVEVEQGFVPFAPLKHGAGPLLELAENDVHGLDGGGEDFERFSIHDESLAPGSPGVNESPESVALNDQPDQTGDHYAHHHDHTDQPQQETKTGSQQQIEPEARPTNEQSGVEHGVASHDSSLASLEVLPAAIKGAVQSAFEQEEKMKEQESLLAEMHRSIQGLAHTLHEQQVTPSAPIVIERDAAGRIASLHRDDRQLMVHRDLEGRIASIEEV